MEDIRIEETEESKRIIHLERLHQDRLKCVRGLKLKGIDAHSNRTEFVFTDTTGSREVIVSYRVAPKTSLRLSVTEEIKKV